MTSLILLGLGVIVCFVLIKVMKMSTVAPLLEFSDASVQSFDTFESRQATLVNKEEDSLFTCPTCQATYKINATRFVCSCGEHYKKKDEYLSVEQQLSPFLVRYTKLLATLAKLNVKSQREGLSVFQTLLQELEVSEHEQQRCHVLFEQYVPNIYSSKVKQEALLFNEDETYKELMLYSCLRVMLCVKRPSEAQFDFLDEVVSVLQLNEAVTDRMMYEVVTAFYLSLDSLTHEKSAHELLHVEPKCSKQTLKTAYRHLIQQYHPDKVATLTLAPDIQAAMAQRFIEITEAYEQLKEAKR